MNETAAAIIWMVLAGWAGTATLLWLLYRARYRNLKKQRKENA